MNGLHWVRILPMCFEGHLQNTNQNFSEASTHHKTHTLQKAVFFWWTILHRRFSRASSLRANIGSLFHTLTKWTTTNYQRNIDWLWNHSHVTEKGESQPSCLALVESRLLTLSFRSCYIKSCSIIAGGSPRRCRFCRWSYLGVWMSSASKSLASVHPIHLLVEIAGLLETGDRHLGCQRSFEDSPQTRRLWGMRLCVQSLHSLEALATCWCHHQGWHSQWERYKKMMCGQEKCNYPG